MLTVWETHEHHVKCAADSQAMAKVLAFLGPALGGAPVIKNIDVGDQYAEVLDADFTEFSFVEVKPHAPIEQTDKLLERLVESTCGVEEYRKPVHGYTVGSPDSKSVYGVIDTLSCGKDGIGVQRIQKRPKLSVSFGKNDDD